MTAVEGFKVKPSHFMPIVIVLTLATALVAALKLAYVTPPASVAPFEETGSGPFLNAVYFVAIVAGAGGGVYFLTRLGLARALTVLMGCVFAVVAFAVATLYWPVAFWMLSIAPTAVYDLLFLLAVSATVVVVVYGVFVRKGAMRSALLLFLGAALGAMLGFSIPTLSALIILTLLAAYDVFAVYVGPVGKLVREGRVASTLGLTVVFGDLEIGLGDLVFYSMLASVIFMNFSLWSFAATIGGVFLGVSVTFKMLEHRRVLPGLPFSLSLGIVAATATHALGA